MLLLALITLTWTVSSAGSEYVTIQNGTCESHGHRTITSRGECENMAAVSAQLLCGAGVPARRYGHTTKRLKEIEMYKDMPTIKNNPKYFKGAGLAFAQLYGRSVQVRVLSASPYSQMILKCSLNPQRCIDSSNTQVETQLCLSSSRSETNATVVPCWDNGTWPYQMNLFWGATDQGGGVVDAASTGTKPHGCMMYLREDRLSSFILDGKVLWVAGYGGKPSNNEQQICATSFGEFAAHTIVSNLPRLVIFALLACPVGKFRTSATSTDCTDCPSGKYSAPDDDECVVCPPGYFCEGGSTFVTVAAAGSRSGSDGQHPCTNAGFHEIISESECMQVAENSAFKPHPTAIWGGVVDYKDNSCTKYMDDPCPDSDIVGIDAEWAQPTGCES
jgi:hypothetical protein